MSIRQIVSDKLLLLESIGILDKNPGYSVAIMSFMDHYDDNEKVQHTLNEYYFSNINTLLDNLLRTERVQTRIADTKRSADLDNDDVLSSEITRVTQLLDNSSFIPEEKEEESFNVSLLNLESDLRFIMLVSPMLMCISREYPALHSENPEIFYDRIGTLLKFVYDKKNEVLGQEQISLDEINQFLGTIVLEIMDRSDKGIEDAPVIDVDESGLSWVDQQKVNLLTRIGVSSEQICNLVPAYRALIFNPNNIVDEVKSEHTEYENSSDDELPLIGSNDGDS